MDTSLIVFAEADRSFAMIGSVLMGVATALSFYFGRPYYWRLIDYLERDFRDRLRRLHLPTENLRRNLIVWTALIVIVFVGFLIGTQSPIFGLTSALLLLCVPWYLIRVLSNQHKRKIEDQLADAMVGLAGAVRAGLSLAQSMEILAEQSPRPIKYEFARIVGEYDMGKPLDRTLDEAKQRLRSENFALFAAAILASRESGGRLNETVDRIAHSVREMQRLERKVQADTAMARKSAIYMALAPFFILVVYYFVDPGAVRLLFVSPLGQLVLSAAVVLNVVAYMWARLILNPDI